MATPTSDPVLPPRIDNATPAPDGRAMRTPTHRLLAMPLNIDVNGHNSTIMLSKVQTKFIKTN